MDTDRKHRLEIAKLKRQLKRAQRHARNWEEIANIRKAIMVNVRDDLMHFCKEWLACKKMLWKNWRQTAKARKLWANFCDETMPTSEEDIIERMQAERLFEAGEIPEIKKPEK